ncbi:MAG: TPM domain-containing protein, partial [Muribaculum sp.]|nr:TPM domain-containing protein [Muribaculum sp.]
MKITIHIDRISRKKPIRQRKMAGLLALAVISLLVMIAQASEYPANPNESNRYEYVADPAGALSGQTVEAVNNVLEHMRRQTTVEMAVAVVPGIGDEEIQPYAVGLFEEWGLGNADNDNGVLLAIDTGGRQYFLMTGYGVEGVLPDAVCMQLLSDNLVPAWRGGDLDAGVLAAVKAVAKIVEEPANAEELRSGNARNAGGRHVETLDPEVMMNFLYFVIVIAFVVSALLFIGDSRGRNLDSHQKSLRWRQHMAVYWILAVLSAGTGLVFALLALMRYRHTRNGTHRCPTCGTKMNKLSETEDNKYLSAGQDFEENLGTVDYDVWLCPRCGTLERFPYRENQKKYTECPACHTVAMTMTSDVVTRRPTTRSEGMGVRNYECLFCHHKEQKPYRIPRRNDDGGAALAAGMALGALGSRGGGGF